jgi:hypothetical protein
MFHYRLIELESEILAKEQSQKGLVELTPECDVLMKFVEDQIGIPLCGQVPKDWKGWLSYRRINQSLVISRGRAFKEGLFSKVRAGLDVANGLDSINDYQRGFDVSPPHDLDHLLVNFGGPLHNPHVFLWYGENIAAYKLIFQATVLDDPHHELSEAVVEACTWILQRPKDKTLTQFLTEIAEQS